MSPVKGCDNDVQTFAVPIFQQLPLSGVEAVYLCCGNTPILRGEAGVDVLPRSREAWEDSEEGSHWYQMDALDFMVLRCRDKSLAKVVLIHGPEHFTVARFGALAKIVLQKLVRGGKFAVEFPDYKKVLYGDNSPMQRSPNLPYDLLGGCSKYLPEHLAMWRGDEMVEFLKRAGFRDMAVHNGYWHSRPDRDTVVEARK